MAQGFASLPTTWESWIEFWVPGFSLASPQLFEGTWGSEPANEGSISLSPLSLFLCIHLHVSLPFQKIDLLETKSF